MNPSAVFEAFDDLVSGFYLRHSSKKAALDEIRGVGSSILESGFPAVALESEMAHYAALALVGRINLKGCAPEFDGDVPAFVSEVKKRVTFSGVVVQPLRDLLSSSPESFACVVAAALRFEKNSSADGDRHDGERVEDCEAAEDTDNDDGGEE